jgi:hypothetical protein
MADLPEAQQTSSLAQWFDDDDGPTHLQEIEAPSVMATPASVVAYGLNSTVMVLHMADGFLAFSGLDDELITEDRFTLDCLACLVWQLPRLVMACSDSDEPDEELAFRTAEGITVERINPGMVALGTVTDDSVKLHLPPAIAWQLVAELTALMVRRMVETAGMVDQLEAALEQSA